MDGAHKHLFGRENLLAILRAAGFEEVRAREFDEAIDAPERRTESIFAEGFKPRQIFVESSRAPAEKREFHQPPCRGLPDRDESLW
jgi:hypothetical protein